MDQTLLAGYHKIKVTPPLGLLVPGYFAQRTAVGILNQVTIPSTIRMRNDNCRLAHASSGSTARSINRNLKILFPQYGK